MRLRIVIDTRDGLAVPGEPFTLTAFRDDNDGTPGRENLAFHEDCAVGGDLSHMLRRLADEVEAGRIEDEWGNALPNTGAEWRANYDAIEGWF